jgi:hypothetical protein
VVQFSPNARYDHVFAIIRVDVSCDVEPDYEQSITVKKIVRSQEEAEAEVARLNRLRKSERSKYFWQITRMERAHTLTRQ